ncbi:MAG: VWA domain-containing protein [Deltaproteobacteria bacterium]|nr:VWA domain-containing protein [Deltaproteobacteria bacterium]
MRRWLLIAVGLVCACGARSDLLVRHDRGADAGADAGDAAVDASGIPCGTELCTGGAYCCSLDRCASQGTCCSDEDCDEGLSCVDGGCAVVDLGCGLDELLVDPNPPNLMILLDRSGSMADRVVDVGAALEGGTKWEVAERAIRSVIPGYDGEVRFGLMMFPMWPGFDDWCQPGAIDVELGDGTSELILDAVAGSGPGGGTPIATSLRSLGEYQGLADPTRRNLVLFISDGGESCDADPIEEVRQMVARTPSIALHVVGFGGEFDEALLAEIARMSGTERPTEPPYYVAQDRAELSNALGAIVASIAPCGFTLSVIPPVPEDVWVVLDEATAVARDQTHLDGWDHEPESNVLTFYGPACDLVKTNTHRVRVIIGCAR